MTGRQEGSFEPFGSDYQAGTAVGAAENGIYLRLPGQWDDGTWDEAASGAGIYYNVHRWLAYGIGSYTSADPLPLERFREPKFAYSAANPISITDPLGLASFRPCSDLPEPNHCECDKNEVREAAQVSQQLGDAFCEYRNSPETPPEIEKAKARGAEPVGEPGPSIGPAYRPQGDPCKDFCVCEHERQHERDLRDPRVAQLLSGQETQQRVNWLECRAYFVGTKCLQGFALGGIR